MTILDKLSSQPHWLAFYEYKKTGGHVSDGDLQELWDFIQKEEYLPIVAEIRAGEPFALPRMRVLNKKNTTKKRVVFTCPPAENMVLKMMAWCLQQYDSRMAKNLYSFRRNIGVKQAVQDLIRQPDINEMYSYKLDIHD